MGFSEPSARMATFQDNYALLYDSAPAIGSRSSAFPGLSGRR